MKIKSLLLGSIAATGLSAGAFAADLNVLTSLDVCDALGISGLTISSDTNCLQITGEAKYEFSYGNYNGDNWLGRAAFIGGTSTVMAANGAAGLEMDWVSKVDAYLKFVGTADSDFGPASVTIKLDYDDDYTSTNEVVVAAATNAFRIEEAYTSVGDTTVIMAGQKSSVFNSGDDSSYTWLKPFNYDKVDTGVETAFIDNADAGPTHVIQVVSDLGNGFSVAAGLENLNGVNGTAASNPLRYGSVNPAADDGTMVGVLAYAGDTVTAHASLIGGGFLDGTVERWGVHAGLTATVDMFKFVAAIAADNAGEWNALASAQATFDMFTLAATVEGDSGPLGTPGAGDQWGASVSGSAAVTDAVTLNLGFRWADQDVTLANTEIWTAAAGLAFAATETITLTGEIGVHGTTMVGIGNVLYGSAEAAWAPGGGYTSSLKGEVNSANAYKVTYKAAKSFK